jgi:FtsH-binding integral membrane protein
MNDRTPVPLPPIPQGCGILPVAQNHLHRGLDGELIGDPPTAMGETLAADPLRPDDLERHYRTVLARAFALCAGALLVTSAVAASLVQSPVLRENPVSGQGWAKVIFLSQLVILAFCGRFVEKLSIAAAAVLLFGYAAFCGLEFSALAPPAALAAAFLCAGCMYAGTALWGYLRGSDLAHPATPIAMMLAGGALLAGINRALGMPRLSWTLSSIAVVIFAALAGFHAQEIRDYYQDFDDDNRAGWKASLVGALLLLLNSVNLYLLVASIWFQLARYLSDDDDGHHDCLPDR